MAQPVCLIHEEFFVPAGNSIQPELDKAMEKIADEQCVGTHVVADELIVSITVSYFDSKGTMYVIFYRSRGRD